jgi:hypothetical protein
VRADSRVVQLACADDRVRTLDRNGTGRGAHSRERCARVRDRVQVVVSTLTKCVVALTVRGVLSVVAVGKKARSAHCPP